MTASAKSVGLPLRVLRAEPGDRLIPLDKLRDPLNPGRRLPLATVLRWAKNGKGGIQLPVIRIGRRLATTEQALVAWFAETTSSAVATITPIQMDSHRRAETRLKQLGII